MASHKALNPKEIINGIDDLLSLPDVVLRANELLDSDAASAQEIGSVISLDPGLSARLLKLVNSAFYGFPGQIDTISRAVTMIGTNELQSLILATTATNTFNNIAAEHVDMNSFWHRSVFCGLLAKKIYSRNNKSKGEALFLIGLLHDIGKLILFAQRPVEAAAIISSAANSQRTLADIENEILGFPTAHLGAELLKSWRLPEPLWVAIRHQHRPTSALEFEKEARALNLAIAISNAFEPSLKSQQPLDTDAIELDQESVACFDLDQDALCDIVLDASLESFDTLTIINPAATTIY